tara:strand:+ start:1317 stop:1805 length:489 start_codon:yes stop_codon:yes gene_type:complete
MEVAAGASILGTYMSVQGARAQGKAQAAASRYNAAINDRNAKSADIQADWTKLRGDIETLNFVDDFRELNAATAQRVRYDGWTLTGTGLDVYMKNAQEADEEKTIREVDTYAEMQAYHEKGVNERLSANLNRMYAKSYLTASRYRAAGAAAAGISKTAYMLT